MPDRSRGRWLLAGLAALLVTVAIPAWAVEPAETMVDTVPLAQDDGAPTAADLGLVAVAGHSGHVVRGRPVPVEVRIEPDRLVAGELRVLSDTSGRRQAEVRDIEVSAGSAKVFRFVVPPAGALTVELETADGTVRANAGADRSARFLVGVLGEALPTDVPPLRTPGFDVSATVVSVDPTWLERGPAALESLSALIVDAGTLRALPDEAIAAVASWVAAGSDLVVVTDAGPVELPLPWSPASAATAVTAADADGDPVPLRAIEPTENAWSLTVGDVLGGDDPTVAATTINAGRGRTTVVGVALGEGPLGSDGRLWGLVAPPHGSATRFDEGSPFARLLDIAPQTLQTGGIDLPGLGGLALFVIAYVLVVGPINGVVLNRLGRQELAWGTIPAITLVFAAAAWVGAGASSPGVGLSGTAAWWIDDVGTETAVVGLRSPREGSHTIELPGPDWNASYASWGRPALVDRSGGDTEIGLELTALELGSVVASRPATVPPPLEVTVEERGGDGLTVVVRNVSSTAIEGVAVRTGTNRRSVGDLAAGAEERVELRDVRSLRRRNAWEDDLVRGPDGIPKSPDSLEAVLRWQVLDESPGVIWATGTVRGGLPSLPTFAADGAPTADIGSFIAVGVTPQVESEILPIDVNRELVLAGFGDAWRSTPWAIEGSIEAVLRYRLPHTPDADTLVSTLHVGEMFDGGGMEACFPVELRDEDGSLLSAIESCGDPSFPEPPPCPDGLSCEYDGTTVTLCEGDTCRTGEIVVPDLPELPQNRGLEIWDVAAREWVGVDLAFDGETAPVDRFVNPLGEVLVRASGQLHPFEFSARGLGATATTEASR